MTDEITQNDCQGEQMYSAEIPINIELGSGGLYYGTSPAMKGLLVTGNSIKELMDRVPNAIAEMRAVAAMGPEIARLQAELNEARDIIRPFAQIQVDGEDLDSDGVPGGRAINGYWASDAVTFGMLRRARAFLKGETDA